MLAYGPSSRTSPLELVSPEQRQQLLTQWQSPPPWGGTWSEFFDLFPRAAALGQPGAQVSQLYQWSYGERHATVPEVRRVLENGIDAGIVVRILDETPTGSQEYFLLQPSWLLDAIRLQSNQSVSDVGQGRTGQDVIQALASFSFDECAKRHGFQEGSTLTATALMEFFREGPYTATDIYKSQALYPTGVDRFYHAIRSFIDEVLQQGVQAGVVVISKNEHGQEMYGLAPCLKEKRATQPEELAV
jgi:hypothetical protein